MSRKLPVTNFTIAGNAPGDDILPVASPPHREVLHAHGLICPATAARVNGSAIALQALSMAFHQRHLVVSPNILTGAEAFEESIRSLIAEQRFPDLELCRHIKPGPEDLAIPESITYSSEPAFNPNCLNIDRILAVLRFHAKIQGSHVVYQLGILTQVDNHTTAQLFPMNLDDGITLGAEDIWMHRTCTRDELSSTGYYDLWRGFTVRLRSGSVSQQTSSSQYFPSLGRPLPDLGQDYLRPRSLSQLHLQHKSTSSTSKVGHQAAPSSLSLSRSHSPSLALSQSDVEQASQMPADNQDQQMDLTTSQLVPSQQSTGLTPGSLAGGTVAVRLKHQGSRAAWDNLFLLNGHPIEEVVDDILGGAVHPKNICGRLILEIAKVRSNSQIKTALIDLYQKAGERPPSSKGQAFTKLITMALKAKAGKNPMTCREDDADYVRERKALNDIRDANSIKYHHGTKTDTSNAQVPFQTDGSLSIDVTPFGSYEDGLGEPNDPTSLNQRFDQDSSQDVFQLLDLDQTSIFEHWSTEF